LTVVSGVLLLLVFFVVGWSVRRRATLRDRRSGDTDERKQHDGTDPGGD
jgi:hypothetical protein